MEDNSINIIEAITIASPFVAAYLAYFFSIKSKKKDIDIEKEKHLNITLSFLLLIWNDLISLRSLIYVIKDKSDDLIFPKKFFSILILSENLLSEDKFKGLKNSIEGIKEYDAITYFHLEDIGENLNEVKSKYIIPFLEIDNIDDELIDIVASKFIDDFIKEYEGHILSVANLISKRVKKKTSLMILDSNNKDILSIINEMNINYYQFMLSVIPEDEVKPSYNDFLELSKDEDYKKIIEIQIDMLKNNGMSKFLNIISENPDISTEEVIALYNKNTNEEK